MQPDLEQFLTKIKNIGYSVKLDTNGFLPDKLIDLVNKGLVDYVAMDIKSSPSGYGRATGIRNFNITPINQSIEFLKSGKVDFEFRTTVVKELHSEIEIQDIGDWIAGDHKYYLQGFEDSGNLINDGLHGYGEKEMKSLLNLLKNRIPKAEIRGL